MTLNRRISEKIDEPDRKRRYVRRLFAGVAERYDLTNDVMSFGLHRRWKRQLLDVADIEAGQAILDLAAGTGDLGRGALEIGRRGGFPVHVFAADLTPEMMRVGRGHGEPEPAGWIAGDAAALPFPDASFDRVLIGYGLRNFAHLDRCLREILRCLKPGGRMVSLDFGHPPNDLIRGIYIGYLNASTRVVGWALHRDPESYVYIPESLRTFPGQREVAERMRSTGFTACGYRDLMFGTMGLNFGDRA